MRFPSSSFLEPFFLLSLTPIITILLMILLMLGIAVVIEYVTALIYHISRLWDLFMLDRDILALFTDSHPVGDIMILFDFTNVRSGDWMVTFSFDKKSAGWVCPATHPTVSTLVTLLQRRNVNF